MTAVNEFILSYLLNSIWQIPLVAAVAACGAYLLRNSSGKYRHTLWAAALIFCLVAPLITATKVAPMFSMSIDSFVSPPSKVVPGASEITDADDAGAALNHTQRSKSKTSITAPPQMITFLVVVYGLFLVFASIRFVRLWVAKDGLYRSANFHGLTPSIATAVQQCRNIFQVKNLQVAYSKAARVPYTFGVRQPVIILPESFCSNADQDTLLAVIAHEVAHVQRRDFLTKIFCELVSVPVSFHPFTFLLKRQVERERELACDELVTRFVLSRNVYARSLLRAANLTLCPAPGAVMLSVFDGRLLEKRIMQLTKNRPLVGDRAGKILASVAVTTLSILSLGLSAFGFALRTAGDVSMPSTMFTRAVTSDPVSQSIKEVGNQIPAHVQFNSPDAQERARAACAAARTRDLASIPSLVAMLADEARTNLITCWAKSKWSPALETFKHPSPGEQAALALASMGDPAFLPLVQQLDNPNPVVRKNSAWAIGELTNMISGERTSAVPQLMVLLDDPDLWVRMAAARALGELRDRRATNGLIVNLTHSDWRVRQLAAWALSELKDDRAVARLCELLLTDARAEVRSVAASALGEIRSANALPSLKTALNDPEEEVRAKVIWAIDEIEGAAG